MITLQSQITDSPVHPKKSEKIWTQIVVLTVEQVLSNTF